MSNVLSSASLSHLVHHDQVTKPTLSELISSVGSNAPSSSSALAVIPKSISSSQAYAMRTPLPEGFIAASDEMRELVSIIRSIAPTQITVLLSGESGTGKEVVARAIHDLSDRRRGPFVTVNCGAIPEGLIESELFGHEKGSFTGAVGRHVGLFEAANGGSIFLDEIGEMPLAMQVKLLRVLETGTFSRVGSTETLHSDARIIAATNRDLEQDVRSGSFRSDLYYRLRAVVLQLPPLRNRREEIPLLLEEFISDAVRRHSLTSVPRLEPAALQLLMHHEWQGNVRELKNTIEQLAILACSPLRSGEIGLITESEVSRTLEMANVWSQGNRSLPMLQHDFRDQSEREILYRALFELRREVAELKHLILHGQGEPSRNAAVALPPSPMISHEISSVPYPTIPPQETVSFPEEFSFVSGNHEPQEDHILSLEALEQNALRSALEKFAGNRRQTAEALGISERTLYRKLKDIGIA